MPRVSFDQLLDLYQSIDFDAHGDEGSLPLSTPKQIATLQLIESDDSASEDANLFVLSDSTDLMVGQTVRVRIGQPRIGLGILARTFDDLLHTSEARTTEPAAYFVVDGRLDAHATTPPAIVLAYRRVLDLVALFAKAAAYLDKTRQELVFVHEGRVVVPLRYDTKTLERVSIAAIATFLENFKDDVHQDQKLAILETTIIQMVASIPVAQRFIYLLDNIESLEDNIKKGYRLFASSFSYSKIRSEVEAARVDYIAKIHKTLIDIQGQLLGIPISTIIVATQFKISHECGIEFWTNVAVLAGAWVFLALLLIAIINQWVTLSVISDDIKDQKRRLESEYAAVSEQFTSIFNGLTKRVHWHYGALIGIAAIAVVSALFASYAFIRLTTAPMTCLRAMSSNAPPTAEPATAPPVSKSTSSKTAGPNQVPLQNGTKVP